MRFEELNWMDVEKYLAREKRLILVLGSCEQHGYLSLMTDTKVPAALADAISRQNGVLVAPALGFGHSPYFLTYPGTISLKISTYISLVEDIIRSVYSQGFRGILIMNGHGGNEPVQARLSELANELKGMKIAWYSWWTSGKVKEIAQANDLPLTHASWLESFQFTRVADLPTEPKAPVRHEETLRSAVETRIAVGDGNFGGPYRVSDEIMDQVFNACATEATRLLKGLL
jgi:creatinine amidohydrolase